MPIYVYRCPKCSSEVEEIRCVSEIDAPAPTCCGVARMTSLSDPASLRPGDLNADPILFEVSIHAETAMTRTPTTASFGFKTKGGNFASFSPSRGPVTRGNRKPKTIGRGAGLGGRRAPPSPKNDPEFRAQLVREFSQRGIKS